MASTVSEIIPGRRSVYPNISNNSVISSYAHGLGASMQTLIMGAELIELGLGNKKVVHHFQESLLYLYKWAYNVGSDYVLRYLQTQGVGAEKFHNYRTLISEVYGLVDTGRIEEASKKVIENEDIIKTWKRTYDTYVLPKVGNVGIFYNENGMYKPVVKKLGEEMYTQWYVQTVVWGTIPLYVDGMPLVTNGDNGLEERLRRTEAKSLEELLSKLERIVK